MAYGSCTAVSMIKKNNINRYQVRYRIPDHNRYRVHLCTLTIITGQNAFQEQKYGMWHFAPNYFEHGSATGSLLFDYKELMWVTKTHWVLFQEHVGWGQREQGERTSTICKKCQGLKNNTADREYRKNLIYALCPKWNIISRPHWKCFTSRTLPKRFNNKLWERRLYTCTYLWIPCWCSQVWELCLAPEPFAWSPWVASQGCGAVLPKHTSVSMLWLTGNSSRIHCLLFKKKAIQATKSHNDVQRSAFEMIVKHDRKGFYKYGI